MTRCTAVVNLVNLVWFSGLIMEVVNIHEAKTHLSRLLEGVQRGESVIIAKSGKPIARLIAMEPEKPARERRLGFLKGQFTVPDNFDHMAETEIAEMFECSDEHSA